MTAATRYELEQRKDGGSWSKVHDATAISKALSGLANGTYEYRVRACVSTACAGYSAIKATVVLAGVPIVTAPATNTTGSYTVSWTGVTTAARYELEQRKDAGAWSKIHDAATTSRALSGQGPGSYAYRARACKGTVGGGWSAVVTTAVSGPPGTPTLTGPALAYRNQTYSLNWSASTGTTNYELQEDPRGGGFGTIYTGGGSNTTLQRSLGGTYRYRVRACNGAGCSALRGVLSDFGKEGVANGVTVVADTSGIGMANTSTKGGKTTIALNVARIYGQADRHRIPRQIVMGAVLSHEGEHGKHQRAHGMPTTPAQAKAGEMSASRVEARAWQGLGTDSWWGTWTSAGGINEKAIEKQADAGVETWCAAGACE